MQTETVGRLCFSVSEAAQASGLSASYLRNEIRDGNLPATKRGKRVLIMEQDFSAYLKGGTTKPRDPESVLDQAIALLETLHPDDFAIEDHAIELMREWIERDVGIMIDCESQTMRVIDVSDKESKDFSLEEVFKGHLDILSQIPTEDVVNADVYAFGEALIKYGKMFCAFGSPDTALDADILEI